MSRNGLFGPNLGREPFELKFAILDGPGPAIEFLLLSWTETAFLGQILAESLLDLKFAILDGPGPAIEFLFWE